MSGKLDVSTGGINCWQITTETIEDKNDLDRFKQFCCRPDYHKRIIRRSLEGIHWNCFIFGLAKILYRPSYHNMNCLIRDAIQRMTT